MLARGTWATLLWLAIVTLAVVAVGALVLALFDVTLSGSEGSSFMEDFWQSLLRVIDPGTMAGDVGWGRRLLALLITLFGLLVAGTLIGVIAAGVEDRIERMRRGRSVVFESGHVVLLGASDRLPLLVRQLAVAREKRGNSVIVVMTDGDPAEIQDRVSGVAGDLRGSRLVFRSGDPANPSDLALVRLETAEMVLVLNDENAGDARAIRTVIAVAAALGDGESTPIVVELSEAASAENLVRAYPGRVHPMVPGQAISRIATAALREPGVGHVVMALLDDRGSDVHIGPATSLEGHRFVDVLNDHSAVRPIGIIRGDGMTELNPPPESRFGPQDRLVVVGDSFEDVATMSEPPPRPLEMAGRGPSDLSFERLEQHLLVWGWSETCVSMLAGWAEVAAPTSSVDVLAGSALIDIHEAAPAVEAAPNLTMTATDDFSHLAHRLGRSPPIDTVLICATPTGLGDEDVDSRTLLTIVELRRLFRSLPQPHPRLLVEILDVGNIPLADMPNADDFVVSEAIASQLTAQLAEQPERREVFLQLYEPSGPSIHLVPAAKLGLSGPTLVSDLYASAYRVGVLAIGWRRAGRGELVLNPQQTQQVDLDPNDQVVVIG